MIVRVLDRRSLINITSAILNSLRAYNAVEYIYLHPLFCQLHQKPNEVLEEVIEVLKELAKHKI